MKTLKAQAEEIAKVLGAEGKCCEQLDELVHEAASHYASSINNQGLDSQVQFLLERRWTPAEIYQALGIKGR